MGRYFFATLLLPVVLLELLVKFLLVFLMIFSIIGIVFLADFDIGDFLVPSSLGLFKSLAIDNGDLTPKQKRELEYQRQRNVILQDTARLERELKEIY